MNDSLGKNEETRNHLRRAVYVAADYLENNLLKRPTVDELAKVAGLSKFHFQRAFKDVVGETLGQHSRRLRLERVACLLMNSSWQITDIAEACGFSSQANLARDFQKLYGRSPFAFRSEEDRTPFLRGHFRKKLDKEIPRDQLPLPTVTIEDWPTLEMICLRYYGPYEKVDRAWKELVEWAKTNIDDLAKARFLGLWYDEWTSADPEKANYRYDCAIVLPEPMPGELPPPFIKRQLPEGLMAVSHARGTMKQLDRAWRRFGLGWFPLSEFQPRGEIAGIDKYDGEVILASKTKQLLMLARGISLTMHIPIQRELMVI